MRSVWSYRDLWKASRIYVLILKELLSFELTKQLVYKTCKFNHMVDNHRKAGKLLFSALCYKWNSEGLMEKKLQVSHFPLYYWVGTTHWDQLSVGHKRNDSEVHHRSSCLPLWSASHQQCGHQTLQLEGTCESHPLQHPAQEGQLELDSGWLTMNVNETQQKHQG